MLEPLYYRLAASEAPPVVGGPLKVPHSPADVDLTVTRIVRGSDASWVWGRLASGAGVRVFVADPLAAAQ